MYTEKSFHGQPRLEYHAFSQQNKRFSLLKNKALFVLFLCVRSGGQNSNADQSYSSIKVSLFTTSTNRDVN